MSAVRVREAVEADFPDVMRLLGELDESMYARHKPADEVALRSTFEAVLRDPNQHLLLAEVDGRVAGTLHVMVLQHLDLGLKRSAVVEGVVVDASYRRAGVGAALLREAATLARRHGCYKLSLTSNLARTGAHGFYSRLGWKRSHYGYSVELG